jgi:hypothetical protein
MFWMRAYPLLGQVGAGWALEFESFLGRVKWHRADRRVPFGAQKTRGGGGGGERYKVYLLRTTHPRPSPAVQGKINSDM